MRTRTMIDKIYILTAMAVFVFAGATSVANAARWSPTTQVSRDIDGDGTAEDVYLWNTDSDDDGNLDNWSATPVGALSAVNSTGGNRAVVFDDRADAGSLRIGYGDGSTGELEIRNQLVLGSGAVIGDGGTGTLNHYADQLYVYEDDLDVKSGTYNMMGGLLETRQGGLNIGSAGTVDITGGSFLVRRAPRGVTGGPYNGTLRVAGSAGGSGPTSIDFDRSDDGNSWQQIGLLELAFDESGITPIEVSSTTGGGATFESGSELDLSFLEGVTTPAEETTWNAMIFGQDGITDNGLSLTGDTDDTKWSYSFVDTSGNGTEDALQVTYIPEPSSLALLALAGLLLMKRSRRRT